MENTIKEPNPFGIIDEVAVQEFEALIQRKLPSSYRDYLLSHNGGSFIYDHFAVGLAKDEFLELEDLYSLNVGPEYRCLNQNHSLAEHYDLLEFKAELSHLIVIGSATSGTYVVLNLLSGEVLFYEPDHDYEEFKANPEGFFEVLAPSFDIFVNDLISEDKAEELEGGK